MPTTFGISQKRLERLGDLLKKAFERAAEKGGAGESRPEDTKSFIVETLNGKALVEQMTEVLQTHMETQKTKRSQFINKIKVFTQVHVTFDRFVSVMIMIGIWVLVLQQAGVLKQTIHRAVIF